MPYICGEKNYKEMSQKELKEACIAYLMDVVEGKMVNLIWDENKKAEQYFANEA